MPLSFTQCVWEGLSVFPVMGGVGESSPSDDSPCTDAFLPSFSHPFFAMICHSFSAPLHVPLTGHLQNWKLHFNAVVLFSVSWLVSFPAPDFKIRWIEGVTCFLTKVNKAPNRNSCFTFAYWKRKVCPLQPRQRSFSALQPSTLTRTHIFPQMKGIA